MDDEDWNDWLWRHDRELQRLSWVVIGATMVYMLGQILRYLVA